LIISTRRIECPQIVAAIEDFKPTVLIGINGKALKAVWAGPDPHLVIDLAETGLTENDRKSLEFNVCFRSEDYHSCLTHR